MKLTILEKEFRKIDKDSLVVVMNDKVGEQLNKEGIEHKKIDSYTREVNIESKAIDWVKKWSNKKIAENKNIKELFDYDGFSIWWLMDDWLYFSYAYYDSVKKIIDTIEKLKTLIEKEKPEEISLASDEILTLKIVKLICQKRNIELKVKKNNLKILTNKIKTHGRVKAIDLFMRFSWSLRKNWWRLLKLKYQKGKKEPAHAKNKILFFSTEPWTTMIKKDSSTKRGNPYLYPIADELSKNKKNAIKVIDSAFTFSSPREMMRLLREKIMDEEVDYYLFESYIDKRVRKGVKKRLKYFKNRWNLIKESEGFINSFNYDGFDIFGLVEKQFSTYFSFRLKGHLMELEAIKKIIETEKPDVVAITDETRAFARALFHVCKKNKIKAVGIQHGNLEGTIRCIHTKEEISEEIGANHCPIPDKTAVYGENDKRFLLKNFYPEEKVAVTGSQRYDILACVSKIYKKEATLNKLGLSPEKKVISLFTNSNFDEENVMLLRVVFKSIKKFPDLQLVIEPHPYENWHIHEQMKKEAKSNALITRRIDAFELLHISDVVMIYWSTVGLEAMILDKPVIMINLSGQPDRVPYAKAGAALGVYKAADLVPAIKSALGDKEVRNKLRLNREELIRNACYKTDGLASRRIANLIEGFLK